MQQKKVALGPTIRAGRGRLVAYVLDPLRAAPSVRHFCRTLDSNRDILNDHAFAARFVVDRLKV